MFDLRSSLAPIAALAGLTAALLLWLAFIHAPPGHAVMDQLEARLAAARPAAVRRDVGPDASLDRALASPVFAMTTGPGAVTEIPVALSGLAVTKTRKAALISIGGKPADWLDVGATRDGVTIVAVSGAGATIDTQTGFRSIGLLSVAPGPVGPVAK